MAAGGETLVRLIDGATTAPVIGVEGRTHEQLALDCAKMLAVDNTVLYGRVLLRQANARSEIVQADLRLSAGSQNPHATLA